MIRRRGASSAPRVARTGLVAGSFVGGTTTCGERRDARGERARVYAVVTIVSNPLESVPWVRHPRSARTVTPCRAWRRAGLSADRVA